MRFTSTILFAFISLSIYAQSNTKIADSLYAVGKYDEAVLLMEKEDTSSVKILTDLAKYYKANSEDKKALKTYKKILDLDSSRIITALNYGETLLNLNRLKEADSLYEKLSLRYPENAQFYYSRGLANERMAKDSLAFELFKKTHKYDQFHQNALYKLSKESLRNNDYQQALAYTAMGLGKNENNVSLLSITAQTYSAMAVFYEAIPHYEKIIKLGQGNEFIHTKLAYAYYKDGKKDKAIEQYKMALVYEPGNSSTHFLLGKLYANTQDFKQSEAHLLMAIEIKDQPLDGEYFSLALTYKYLEDYKKAFDYFQKTLNENPDHIRALYERAVAGDNYFKDFDTKINYYQAFWNKYYSEDPNYLAREMLYLTKNRISDLKKKKHLAAEKNSEENEKDQLKDSLAEAETSDISEQKK